MTTSNGLPKNALDLSDDSEDEGVDDTKLNDTYGDDKIHDDSWYYKNKERTKFIKSLKVSRDKAKLLKQVGAYLNRILPTSLDYGLIKSY
eukprot:CAMPEP_0201596938 /NCGR_PEP_ID=MMETSP0190_2-20130828/193532_1 /ASSEMBLY_ACC=CAM_ASM_000263 /TAXON_ID=37353 /ORGANISM="Rosalina sp." /LENGTH=89 /DNA_ID=CAMNT_0048057607 /DNA_START=574 /DNA_END=840 /DNA_ORIENTATION=+